MIRVGGAMCGVRDVIKIVGVVRVELDECSEGWM